MAGDPAGNKRPKAQALQAYQSLWASKTSNEYFFFLFWPKQSCKIYSNFWSNNMFHSNYNVNITVKITVIFQVQFCFVILAQTSRPNKSNYFKKHNMLCIYTLSSLYIYIYIWALARARHLFPAPLPCQSPVYNNMVWKNIVPVVVVPWSMIKKL